MDGRVYGELVTVNPLVAAGADGPKDAWSGVWMAEDIELIIQGVKNGSWVDGTLGVVGAARLLTLERAQDDWISDLDVQGDYQTEAGLERPQAYLAMVRQVIEWIGRSVLVPGDICWFDLGAAAEEELK